MEELVYSLEKYISPELVFMIPVLIVVGTMLKKSNRISSSLIPSILCILGIPLALIVSLSKAYEPMTNVQIFVWIITGIGQGVFIGTASVGVHQLFKQHQDYQRLKTWEYEERLREKISNEVCNFDREDTRGE